MQRIYVKFTRALTTKSFRHVVGSGFASVFAAQSAYASVRCMSDFINHSYLGVAGFCSGTKECGIWCFHASSQVWSRRSDELFGLKTPKKEKYVRRDNRNQPPVEAPYVPRNVTATKSNPNKTIEIFEGLTLIELAKCTVKSVSSLQDILTNVAEKVESEFEPLNMDIAELAAMVSPPP